MSGNENLDQFLLSAKTAIDVLASANRVMFVLAEELTALNFSSARDVVNDARTNAQSVFSIKTPQEIASLQCSFGQVPFEKVLAYSRSVYEISAAATGELGSLFQSQCAELSRVTQVVAQEAAKGAPFGENIAQSAVNQAAQLSDSYVNAVSAIFKMVGGPKGKK